MTTAEAPPTDATAEQDRSSRNGCDGAGWFMMILAIALVYGLAVSSISATAGEATSRPPEPPTAAVIAESSP